ncbi:MAG TPA: DUF4062 domain-containing protein [Thermoanaerobaculia bacterium]
MQQVDKVRLFIASPQDLQIERAQVAEVVAELNRTVGRELGLVLEIVDGWRDTRPAMGRPQALVNEQIGSFEIFLGILARRFGTPTQLASSGTEEEFRRAYADWQEKGSPYILFYFSEAPAPPPRSPEEALQLLKVVQFRQEIEAKGLVGTYADPSRFKDSLRPHLHRLLYEELAAVRVPIASGLYVMLEAQREICRRQGIPVYTPSVLLALLGIPQGLAQRSLDRLQPGLSAEIRGKLQDYVSHALVDAGQPYGDFRWEDRPDIRQAQQAALRDGSGEVREKHLLLAVLETESNTREGLRQRLGESSFRHLVEEIRSAPAASVPINTPGSPL